MKLFLLFLLGIVFADKDEYITNGKEAKIEDYPYQACLIGVYFCGGIIISNTYILTAAHCLQGGTPEDMYVLLGAANLREGIMKNILSFVIHSEFVRKTLVNDIGLVKIDHIDFSDRIKSIALPNEEDLDKNFETEDAIISGWGLTDSNGTGNQYLLYADVNIMKQYDCEEQYKPGTVKETNICAVGEGGASTCKGDSGGPLVLKSSGILIGISSYGPKGNCRKSAVFTRVTKYRDWILENSGV